MKLKSCEEAQFIELFNKTSFTKSEEVPVFIHGNGGILLSHQLKL